MRIIPDKLIHLNIRTSSSIQKIKQNVQLIKNTSYGKELQELAERIHSDYDMNISAVRGSFNQFIFECDADRAHTEIAGDLRKMLSLRFQAGAPRRPPKVMIVGPTGSGRTLQSASLAAVYGLVHVCPDMLLKAEAEKNAGIKLKIKSTVEGGDEVPDDIMLRLIDSRLRQADCRINGWVLDGFPQN